MVYGNGFIKIMLGVLGSQVPTVVPQSIADFYTNGYHGVTYWDAVKGFSIFLVYLEYSRYTNANRKFGGKPSAMTQGIFAVIMVFLALITVPELYQRIKDIAAMNKNNSASASAGGSGALKL